MSRLPSLRALRAFQVAGTHLNLADAAEELFITPSGVSHQIRILEDELDVKLFNRTGRGLELTERGAQLLPLLSGVFDQLATVISDFKNDQEVRAVNIAMPATFASRWFIPNLGKFEALNPNVNIRLLCQEGNLTRTSKELDCAIHLGHAEWKGYIQTELFSERVIAVCSPKLLKSSPHLTPDKLVNFRLLEVEAQPDEWATWANDNGVRIAPKTRTLTFETRELALQGAFEGLGIALAGLAEVAEDIRRGRLIPAFDSAEIASGTYYLSVSEQRSTLPSIVALCNWIRSEFSEPGA